MLLIAGLGNPGAEYAGNRHNIGFMAADEIARRHGFSPWRKKFKADIADGELAGEKVLLIKPQTFMNLSGEAVGEALRFYKLSPADLIVLYDELDLPPGKLRVRTGGGAGGHNGIRSIDSHCGNAFHRVRLGIGHPGDKALVQRHVLGDFAKADKVWLDPFLDAVSEHVPLMASGKHSTFMNRVARQTAENDPRSVPTEPAEKGSARSDNKPKGQSHIRQARTKTPDIKPPQTGPLAEMLKKLFGGE